MRAYVALIVVALAGCSPKTDTVYAYPQLVLRDAGGLARVHLTLWREADGAMHSVETPLVLDCAETPCEGRLVDLQLQGELTGPLWLLAVGEPAPGYSPKRWRGALPREAAQTEVKLALVACTDADADGLCVDASGDFAAGWLDCDDGAKDFAPTDLCKQAAPPVEDVTDVQVADVADITDVAEVADVDDYVAPPDTVEKEDPGSGPGAPCQIGPHCLSGYCIHSKCAVVCADANACADTGWECVAGPAGPGADGLCLPPDACYPGVSVACCGAASVECQPDGTNACPPAPAETCNDVDDDCDGQTDEEWPQKGQPCKAGAGTCQMSGTTVCTADHTATVCDATGQPPETPCDDGELSTHSDHCSGGPASTCVGTPYACEGDGLDCTDELPKGDGTCQSATKPGFCVVMGACVASGAGNPLNDCEACDPVTSASAWSARPNGTACSDGNSCTSEDTCTAGTCAGQGLSCDDGLDCTLDDCDGQACISPHSLKPESCLIDGACYANGQVNPENVCEECDAAATATAWTPRTGGPACDDENVCTQGDTCQGGACQGGVTNPCDDANECTDDACDPGAGTPDGCTHAEVLASTPCNFDSNGCTKDDACQAGVCTAGVAVICSDPDQCHSGVCIMTGADTWECGPAPKSIGTPCNDGSACTQDDACTAAGTCAGAPVTCNDGNACTKDACDSTLGCTFPNEEDLAPCDADSNGCTKDDACKAGVCTKGTAVTCTDPSECQTGQCMSTGDNTSTCGAASKPDGTACNDGNACTKDACSGGACAGTPIAGCCLSALDCDDQSACTTDKCSGNLCISTSIPGCCTKDAECIDGNPCFTYTCQSAKCVSTPVASCCKSGSDCDDQNPCTTDKCTTASGVCSNTAVANGAACSDDGLACTSDVCADGACTHAIAAGKCAIQGICYANGAKNPAKECSLCNTAAPTAWSNAAKDAVCSDDNGCTKNDLCTSQGACVGTALTSLDCTDNNACTLDYCSGTSGCDHQPLEGTSCTDDGITCTLDQCAAGACTHTKIDSGFCLIGGKCIAMGTDDPTNQCRTCTPTSSQSAYTNKADNTLCNFDADGCTKDDSCKVGVCTKGTTVTCPDPNDCQVGKCTSTGNNSQTCGATSKANGTACTTDNLTCTTDQCSGGACAHPIASGCLIQGACVAEGTKNPQNVCQACQAAKDTGAYSNLATGTACTSDGLSCTTDACDAAGACKSTLQANSCIIDGTTCVASGALNPNNSCESCQPAVATNKYTKLASGTACTSDSLTCTTDVCDANGLCQHVPQATKCLIGGVCYNQGDLDPSKECQLCNASSNQTGWWPKAVDTACTADANECTQDKCDGSGSCVHPSKADGTACDSDALPCTTQKCDGSGTCVTNTAACSVTCGDGLVSGPEECDQGGGNVANGDGCSSTCTIEDGYACAGTPSVCVPKCGDGKVKGSEACDDGCGGNGCSAADNGDGCTQACAVEFGFVCTGVQPSICASTCGDGKKASNEMCDDGGTASGDGCAGSCGIIEFGFGCTGTQPSVCASTCGDGKKASNEACDDQNTSAGDGCAANCKSIDFGFSCTGGNPTKSICMAMCGDGKKASAEACDDQNTTAGDGCSSTCVVEFAFSCTGAQPSTCSATCGDGKKASIEGCDDQNTLANDGCSATCAVEFGYVCVGGNPTKSSCTATCGDGKKAFSEGCDDGNTGAGDGCSGTCAVEAGFTCTGGNPTPSVCSLTCGGVACPSIASYKIACNATGHCEYTPTDTAGWKQWDVWIYVPPGSFSMGETGLAEPVHAVTFAQGFLVGKYEVVTAEYEACQTATTCTTPSTADWMGCDGSGVNTTANGRGNHPQNGLTWQQAKDFCGWVGTGGRLPTEAEWEYVASGTTHRKYPWGDTPEPTCANSTAMFDSGSSCGCGTQRTGMAGGKAAGASAIGALDMGGNAWEWCEDWWHNAYSGAPTDGTAWVSPGGFDRVLRGGTFYHPKASLRVANRDGAWPTDRMAFYGARCVRPLTCVIGAQTYLPGAKDPANSCQTCQPDVSQTAWTPLPATTTCDDDGLACTSDTCDAGGTCQHVLACPTLAGYTPSCNTAGYCEFTRNDTTGWKQWDVWIYVPPGSFGMGEVGLAEPAHTVTFAKGFLIGKYEVVTAEYEACQAASACTTPSTADWSGCGTLGVNTSASGHGNYPQNGLTWQQGQGFCSWVAPGGRLPTEAEWEYAATGTTHRKYPWGDTPEPTCTNGTAMFDSGPSCGCGTSWSAAAGAKTAGASAFGALDMAGNVWEWCEDWWHSDYTGAPADGTAWVNPSASVRVARSSSFTDDVPTMRVAYRNGLSPSVRYANIGARCVRPLP